MKIVLMAAIGIIAVIAIVLWMKSAHYGMRVLNISERRRAEQANDYAYAEIKDYFAKKVEAKTGRKPEKIALWVSSPAVGSYYIAVYYRYHRVWYYYTVDENHKWMTPEVMDWAKSVIHY